MSTFHENLKRARENLGFTRQELARVLFLSPQNYGQYEKGVREPKLDTLCRMSQVLGVSTDELLGNENDGKDISIIFRKYVVYLKKWGCKVTESESGKICVEKDNFSTPAYFFNKETFCEFIFAIEKMIDTNQADDKAHRILDMLGARAYTYDELYDMSGTEIRNYLDDKPNKKKDK